MARFNICFQMMGSNVSTMLCYNQLQYFMEILKSSTKSTLEKIDRLFVDEEINFGRLKELGTSLNRIIDQYHCMHLELPNFLIHIPMSLEELCMKATNALNDVIQN